MSFFNQSEPEFVMDTDLPIYYSFDNGSEMGITYHPSFQSIIGKRGQALNLTGDNDYAIIGIKCSLPF